MQILRSELGKLARTPERLRWPRLWRALSPSEREFAIGGCLRDDEGHMRSLLIKDIAAENNFRRPTIERKSAHRLAEMGARLKRANQSLIIASLRGLHIDGRRVQHVNQNRCRCGENGRLVQRTTLSGW